MQMEPLQRFGRSYKFNGVTLSGIKKIVGDTPFIFSAQEFSEQINFQYECYVDLGRYSFNKPIAHCI